MKTLLLILVCAFCAFGQNIIATTEDGKKVILKPNGTWEYLPQQEKQVVIYSRPTQIPQTDKLSLPIQSDKFDDLLAFFGYNVGQMSKDGSYISTITGISRSAFILYFRDTIKTTRNNTCNIISSLTKSTYFRE